MKIHGTNKRPLHVFLATTLAAAQTVHADSSTMPGAAPYGNLGYKPPTSVSEASVKKFQKLDGILDRMIDEEEYAAKVIGNDSADPKVLRYWMSRLESEGTKLRRRSLLEPGSEETARYSRLQALYGQLKARLGIKDDAPAAVPARGRLKRSASSLRSAQPAASLAAGGVAASGQRSAYDGALARGDPVTSLGQESGHGPAEGLAIPGLATGAALVTSIVGQGCSSDSCATEGESSIEREQPADSACSGDACPTLEAGVNQADLGDEYVRLLQMDVGLGSLAAFRDTNGAPLGLNALDIAPHPQGDTPRWYRTQQFHDSNGTQIQLFISAQPDDSGRAWLRINNGEGQATYIAINRNGQGLTRIAMAWADSEGGQQYYGSYVDPQGQLGQPLLLRRYSRSGHALTPDREILGSQFSLGRQGYRDADRTNGIDMYGMFIMEGDRPHLYHAWEESGRIFGYPAGTEFSPNNTEGPVASWTREENGGLSRENTYLPYARIPQLTATPSSSSEQGPDESGPSEGGPASSQPPDSAEIDNEPTDSLPDHASESEEASVEDPGGPGLPPDRENPDRHSAMSQETPEREAVGIGRFMHDGSWGVRFRYGNYNNEGRTVMGVARMHPADADRNYLDPNSDLYGNEEALMEEYVNYYIRLTRGPIAGHPLAFGDHVAEGDVKGRFIWEAFSGLGDEENIHALRLDLRSRLNRRLTEFQRT